MFQPTGGAFKSMPSPKISIHPSFDFATAAAVAAASVAASASKASTVKDMVKEENYQQKMSNKNHAEHVKSPRENADPPSNTPPHSSSAGGYPISYFGQYVNQL